MSEGDEEAVGETSEGLQVELFHPESDRKPGDTNIQRFGFDVHPVVFPIALVMIVVFIAITLFFEPIAEALGWTMVNAEGQTVTMTSTNAFETLLNDINGNFGWLYMFAVNVFIAALVYFAISKYGKIRLGGVEADPEFSTFSWMAMLFSAGMGIGLMFWSVAEPMYHFGDGTNIFPMIATGSSQAAGHSLAVTFFHWGFHPWAVYGIVALGLGFFSFNRGLPLTFRSAFYPLLGDRIYGFWGHVIDLVTVFATIFGLGTSLGLGAQQINAGLSITTETVTGSSLISQGEIAQVVIIGVITAIAVVSVAAGLEAGVKRLSTINVYIMVTFLAFMLIVGPTLYILDSTIQAVGIYFDNFLAMAFFTGSFIPEETAGGYADWAALWTIFYWGWWIAWSPFVGIFIARISRGRTVRQMVLGVLLIPTAFSFVWMGAFGGSALYADMNLGAGIYDTVYASGNAFAMFEMLKSFPLETLTSLVAVLLVTTFFVTSSDSGSLVVDHLTSGGKHDVPRVQRIFWAVTEGVVAATLLVGGGLAALQAASVTTGLPFAVILLVMVYTVYLGLDEEYEILQSEEFRDRVSEISGEGTDVQTTGGDIVTDVSDEAESGD
ncbi:MAG: BCCT family transporter [Halobacteriales archaeon]